MFELKWEPILDGVASESERYEYSIGGRGIGGTGSAWLSVHITRKSDGRVFSKTWLEEVPIGEFDPQTFCQAFEDGYIIVFPWEWKKSK
jgi:hypothetical protein